MNDLNAYNNESISRHREEGVRDFERVISNIESGLDMLKSNLETFKNSSPESFSQTSSLERAIEILLNNIVGTSGISRLSHDIASLSHAIGMKEALKTKSNLLLEESDSDLYQEENSGEILTRAEWLALDAELPEDERTGLKGLIRLIPAN